MYVSLRVFKASFFVVGLCSGAICQEDIQVQSGRPVESPDGRRTVAIDRLLPIVDGEPEKNSGRMVVRLVDANTTAAGTQYFIEGSQVRLLDPPTWLDSNRATAYYNIAKNASGLLFVDAARAETLQIELVGLQRESAQPQFELTSFEVTRHLETTATRIRNAVYLGRSVFPLVVPKVPSAKADQLSVTTVDSIQAAHSAFAQFAAEKGLSHPEPEQASETISPDEKHMALLVCSDGRAGLVIVPLTTPSPETTLQATQLHWLATDVQLTACVDAQLPESESSAEEAPMTDRGRYTTTWKSNDTVLVEKENFDEEGEPSTREPLLEVTLDGKVTVPPKPTATPAATATAAPARTSTPRPETPKSVKAPAAAADEPSSPSRPRLQVTTRATQVEKEIPEEPAPEIPETTPEPEPPASIRATPEPTAKPGFFRRLLPGRSRATPASESGREQAAPPDVIPTPSD